jgi:hypothetical protein
LASTGDAPVVVLNADALPAGRAKCQATCELFALAGEELNIGKFGAWPAAFDVMNAGRISLSAMRNFDHRD